LIDPPLPHCQVHTTRQSHMAYSKTHTLSSIRTHHFVSLSSSLFLPVPKHTDREVEYISLGLPRHALSHPVRALVFDPLMPRQEKVQQANTEQRLVGSTGEEDVSIMCNTLGAEMAGDCTLSQYVQHFCSSTLSVSSISGVCGRCCHVTCTCLYVHTYVHIHTHTHAHMQKRRISRTRACDLADSLLLALSLALLHSLSLAPSLVP